MKWIKYQIETAGERIPAELSYSEKNLEIAVKEAYNGEYTVEDDGMEEITEPTQLDRVEAQVTYTAMMTDTLLEG